MPPPRVIHIAAYSAHFVWSPKIDTLFNKLRTAVFRYKGTKRPSSKHTTTATLAHTPFAKNNTIRRRFCDEISVFCREPKNRHINLQTSSDRNLARRRRTPFYLEQDDSYARLHPVCKAQHRAAQFRSIFGCIRICRVVAPTGVRTARSQKRAIRKCHVVAPAGVRTASHHRACCERSERFK